MKKLLKGLGKEAMACYKQGKPVGTTALGYGCGDNPRSFKEWINNRKFIFIDLDDTIIKDNTLRPQLTQFLQALVKIGNIYILSHATPERCRIVYNKHNLSKYIEGFYSTKNTFTLVNKFNLHNNWVLVDNSSLHSPQIKAKLKILGASDINAKKHFIHIGNWNDSLIRFIPEIRHKLTSL